MFKKIFIVNLLLLSIFLISCSKSNKKEEEEIDNRDDLTKYVDNLIEKTPSYFPNWNKESFKNRWNY